VVRLRGLSLPSIHYRRDRSIVTLRRETAMPLPDDEISKRFRYHPPNQARLELHEGIRQSFWSLAAELNALPDGKDPRGSREKSLALTALEESLMWANAHIARNVK
jgi:hypothetical protein